MWIKLKYIIRDYFSFSHAEQQAFIPVILLMAFMLASPFIWREWLAPAPDSHQADRKLLDSLVAELELRQPDSTERFHKYPSEHSKTPLAATPFEFDPNAIDQADWQRLGLPSFLAKRIINYRNKGGKFRIKKDLSKIYGFPPELYLALEPYIQLPDTLIHPQANASNKPFPDRPKEDFRPKAFDLNTVDTLQLEKLKGIGPALARRIVRYRDRLGGFVNLQQLYEVYGLDSNVVAEVLKYGTLPTGSQPKKIYINTATVEQLRLHPYVSPRLASGIIAYRNQHGNFTDLLSLSRVKLLDAQTLRKLEPYIEYRE